MANLDDLRIDSPVPKPKRRRPSRLPWILAAGALLWFGWRFGGERVQQLVSAAQPVREVQVYAVTDKAAPAGSFTAGGYLEVIPPGPRIASALIDGQVRELLVKPGDKVTAGQVIARLDGSLLAQDVNVQRSQVQVAEAQLVQLKSGYRGEQVNQARALLAQAESRLHKAQADHSRYEQLLIQGIVSQAEYDGYLALLREAEGDVAAAQAALDQLLAGQRQVDITIAARQLDSARAQLKRSQAVLAKTEIRAPVSGVVLDVYVQAGAWVSPMSDGVHAGQICSIFDPQKLQAWVDVNQRDIGKVYVGQAVSLVSDAYPDDQLEGRVSRLLPAASIEKNTVRVNISLQSVPSYLRPQLSLQVTFQPKVAADSAGPPPGLEIPAGAVQQDGEKAFVFISSQGKAQRREVQIGAASNQTVRVVSGIGVGDQIITNPEGLTTGQPVRAVGTDTSTAATSEEQR